jgi:outer membrane protein assembly factor BamB
MRIVVGSLCLLLYVSVPYAADNWPQFRGPNGDGQAVDAKLPVEFGENSNLKWKVAIAGKGWSSPIVWGKQIWLTTATEDGKQMFGVCLDRDSGKVIHNQLIFENEKPRFCHPTNSYASPTPVIEEGRVYLHFGSYGTACLDTKTGKTLWTRRDLPCNHWRGPGSSPILHGDLLIVAYDGYDLQYVVALDKNSGKTVWKQDRNIDYGTSDGDRKKAYSTCTVLTHDGRTQVVSPSAVETISYEPATGKVLWRVRHGGMNAAARPVYGHGLVYIAAGTGKDAMIAVRPDGNGDITGSHIEWGFSKGAPKRPSPILAGENLYMIDDSGVATCLDATTAKVLWQARVGGNYRASPLLADGKIYFFELEGKVTVIEASTEGKKVLAENQLDNGFQASPAVAGNSLFLRSTKHLNCFSNE